MRMLAEYLIEQNLTFTAGGYRFGFMDAEHSFGGDVTLCFAGPFGAFPVPFSATQGWTAFSLLLALLLIGAPWALIRRRPAQGESLGK